MQENLLDGKVVVVSGGTKGVGRAICIECVSQGAKVVIGGRDKDAAMKILDEISNLDGQAIFVYTDLTDVKYCANLFDEAVNAFGKVDGFINYAGLTYAASLVECDETLFDDIFNVNIKAAFFCSKHAVRNMVKNGGGSIIMIGSAHAWRGQKDRAAYACSKGALKTLVEHIAYNYAKDHVRCNLVTLGWTATEGELTLRERQGITKDELYDMGSVTVPMGRLLCADDYISGIIYLLSDNSLMVTGSNLRMTGGEYI